MSRCLEYIFYGNLYIFFLYFLLVSRHIYGQTHKRDILYAIFLCVMEAFFTYDFIFIKVINDTKFCL